MFTTKTCRTDGNLVDRAGGVAPSPSLPPGTLCWTPSTRPSMSAAVRAIPRNDARCARPSADTDTCLGSVDGVHALCDPHGLLDQGLHDLRLRHGLDDLALHEDLTLAVARGDAQVGLAGLAGAVDDAAHDRDPQRHLHALEPGGHLLGQRVDVDLRAAAGGAGDDLELPRAQVQRLEDLDADLDLLHRR